MHHVETMQQQPNFHEDVAPIAPTLVCRITDAEALRERVFRVEMFECAGIVDQVLKHFGKRCPRSGFSINYNRQWC